MAAPPCFDDLLQARVGSLGRAQLFIVIVVSLSQVMMAAVLMLMVLTAQDPITEGKWECVAPTPAISNASTALSDATASAPSSTAALAAGFASCNSLQAAFAAASQPQSDLRAAFCRLPPGATRWTRPSDSLLSTYNLTCGHEWLVSTLNSLYFVGLALGGTIFGALSDRLGRRPCLLGCTALTALMAAGEGLAPWFWLHGLCRVVGAAAVQGMALSDVVLVTELVGPDHRGRVGILSQSFFIAGECLLALLAALVPSWRSLTLLCALLTAAYLAVWPLVPESPRWLAASGRRAEAAAVLAQLARRNGRSGAGCSAEEIEAALAGQEDEESGSGSESGSEHGSRDPSLKAGKAFGKAPGGLERRGEGETEPLRSLEDSAYGSDGPGSDAPSRDEPASGGSAGSHGIPATPSAGNTGSGSPPQSGAPPLECKSSGAAGDDPYRGEKPSGTVALRVVSPAPLPRPTPLSVRAVTLDRAGTVAHAAMGAAAPTLSAAAVAARAAPARTAVAPPSGPDTPSPLAPWPLGCLSEDTSTRPQPSSGTDTGAGSHHSQFHHHHHTHHHHHHAAKQRPPTLREAARHPLVQRYFAASAFALCSLVMGYYGIGFALSYIPGSLYVSFFLISIAEAPSALVVGLLIDRLGRSALMLGGMAVAGAACLGCGMAVRMPLLQVLLAMLGKFGCGGAWSVLVVYCAEVFPTSVRTLLSGVIFQGARAGGVAAPFVFLLGTATGVPQLPFLLMGVFTLAGALLVLLLPETMGAPQPESLAQLEANAGRTPAAALAAAWRRRQSQRRGGAAGVRLEEQGKEGEGRGGAVQSRAAAATAASQPHVSSVISRHAAQQQVLSDSAARARDLASSRPLAPAHSTRGFLTEIHHEATFNVDAIARGSEYRAHVVTGGTPVDIRVMASKEVVQEAQIKSYKNPATLGKALRNPQYDGMQKVGPADVRAHGVDTRVTAGDVGSAPLSLDEANRLVQDPERHFRQYRPSAVGDAVQATVAGAAVGAGVGAAVSLGAAAYQRGGITRIEGEDVGVALKNAAVAGAAGGAAGLVGMVSGSSVVGGVAAGSVVAAYSMLMCEERGCAVREAAKGAAGVGAGLAACAATGWLGPAAVVACPLAAWAASLSARKGVAHAYGE
ncbi:hypothetical protein HYH03_016838 [Edaphochlamys debaryana]|uniref:Major facilitator superfamily (MFS) profile domain-containing protein n=1 Tax=Edaphochlamys debaryana TaxID=47281 RepID=A0A835XGN8_9CHLO|nr:hypothetical protein HYH03_016838 [Edaphochlamys debaryana]|eukprot:KAG2484292.1 hypothetical protein HYH03_016838 [Edaphochlamys debaryana]